MSAAQTEETHAQPQDSVLLAVTSLLAQALGFQAYLHALNLDGSIETEVVSITGVSSGSAPQPATPEGHPRKGARRMARAERLARNAMQEPHSDAVLTSAPSDHFRSCMLMLPHWCPSTDRYDVIGAIQIVLDTVTRREGEARKMDLDLHARDLEDRVSPIAHELGILLYLRLLIQGRAIDDFEEDRPEEPEPLRPGSARIIQRALDSLQSLGMKGAFVAYGPEGQRLRVRGTMGASAKARPDSVMFPAATGGGRLADVSVCVGLSPALLRFVSKAGSKNTAAALIEKRAGGTRAVLGVLYEKRQHRPSQVEALAETLGSRLLNGILPIAISGYFSEMVSSLSHSLSALAAGTYAPAEWLLETMDKAGTHEMPSTLRPIVEQLMSGAKTLQFSIQGLAPLAELWFPETGAERPTARLTRSRFSLVKALEEARASFRSRLASVGGRSVRFIIPREDVSLTGSREALLLILWNLFDNALRYGRDGTRVDVSARIGPEACSVRITNRGIGVPRGDLERVFEAGVRGRNAVQLHPTGSGVGLFVADQIARKEFGGSIRILSRKVSGSTQSKAEAAWLTTATVCIPLCASEERTQ